MTPPVKTSVRTTRCALGGAIGLALGLLLAAPADALEVGEPAPAFDLPLCDGDGRLDSGRLFDGSPASLLVFWNTACPDCLADLIATAEALRADSLGVRRVSICTEHDAIGDARRLLRGLDLEMPCAWDVHGLVADRYRTADVSYAIALVDAGGIVRHLTRGHPESIEAVLREVWLEAASLMKETDADAPPDSTRPR